MQASTSFHDIEWTRKSKVTLNVVYEIDIFASSDGSFNISVEHMKNRKNNASVGHSDNEEDLEGMKVDNIILQVENWRKTRAYKNDDYLLKAAKLHFLVFGD